MVSVVIPVYNEEKILSANCACLRRLSQRAELIFSDGGSSDRTRTIASDYGRVVNGKKGRAAQMNFAVAQSSFDILLFLHADTAITQEALEAVEHKVTEDGFIGGCLNQRIDKPGFIYRIIESIGNTRAKLTKVFYGDQAIFVRKDIFLKLGGFPQEPIMEDVLFTKKLRKCGRTIVLPDKVIVSARRWEEKGILKMALLYGLINILFWLRFPLEKIKILYDDVR